MTDEELKAIEERYEKANEVLNGVGVYDNRWTKSHKGMLYLAVQDIPHLIAELKAWYRSNKSYGDLLIKYNNMESRCEELEGALAEMGKKAIDIANQMIREVVGVVGEGLAAEDCIKIAIRTTLLSTVLNSQFDDERLGGK